MLIGLCGGIAAGKDTTYLRAKELYSHDHVVERIGYADKMKESVAALFGISKEFIEAEKRNSDTLVVLSSPIMGEEGDVYNAELSMTFREFLQRYGTEAHREIFNDLFWVDAALPVSFDHSDKIVFVTDARFESELQRIVDLGGLNIYIDNDNAGSSRESQHSSENSIDMSLVSYTIDNRIRDDGFNNLDSQLARIVDEIIDSHLLEA